jgi:hypothetical protein
MGATVIGLLPLFSGAEGRSATVSIEESDGWQGSGLETEAREAVVIEVVGVGWTRWKGAEPRGGGQGSNYICGEPMEAGEWVEPVPGRPGGAVVGWIGSGTFGVGTATRLLAPHAGDVFLRTDDADPGLGYNEWALCVTGTLRKQKTRRPADRADCGPFP